MYRVIKSASAIETLDSAEAQAKQAVNSEDLFAICYGIKYPKRSKSHPGELVVDEFGLCRAKSYAAYHQWIKDFVSEEHLAESSFRFYTAYNRLASGEQIELEEFIENLASGELYTKPYNTKIRKYIDNKIVAPAAEEMQRLVANIGDCKAVIQKANLYLGQTRHDFSIIAKNSPYTVGEVFDKLEVALGLHAVGERGRYRNQGYAEGITSDNLFIVKFKDDQGDSIRLDKDMDHIFGGLMVDLYSWGPVLYDTVMWG